MPVAAADEDLAVHRLGRLHRSRRATELSTGTSRQPSSVRPSRLTICGDRCRWMICAPVGVARHEQCADGVVAGLRQREAELGGLACAKNSCGICTRMPAPSPARGSAPTAPRCSRFTRIVERVLDDLVRLAALDVGDEADAGRNPCRAPDRTIRASPDNPAHPNSMQRSSRPGIAVAGFPLIAVSHFRSWS